jgi:hypothetical protein
MVTASVITVNREIVFPDDSNCLIDACRIEVVSENEPFDLFSVNLCEAKTTVHDLSTLNSEDCSSENPFLVERFRFRVPWVGKHRPKYNRSTAEAWSKKLEADLTTRNVIDDYDKEIEVLKEIDAIVEVSPEYIRHFLPHFGVSTKQGSSMRTRPVFNCISLNKFLRKCKILHKSVIPNILTLVKFKHVRLFDFSKAFLRLEYVDDEKDDVDELLHPISDIGQELPYSTEEAIWEFEGEPACPYMGFVWRGHYYCFRKVLMGVLGLHRTYSDPLRFLKKIVALLLLTPVFLMIFLTFLFLWTMVL